MPSVSLTTKYEEGMKRVCGVVSDLPSVRAANNDKCSSFIQPEV